MMKNYLQINKIFKQITNHKRFTLRKLKRKIMQMILKIKKLIKY